MESMPMPYKGGISTKMTSVQTGNHTTAAALTYEKAGSFTINKPYICRIVAGYTNAGPRGIIVCSSGTSMANAMARIDIPSGIASSSLAVTCFLTNGTYDIYTSYDVANKTNNWYVYVAEFIEN